RHSWYLDQPVLPIWLVGLITLYVMVAIGAVIASSPRTASQPLVYSNKSVPVEPAPAKNPSPQSTPAVISPTSIAKIDTYNQGLKQDAGLQQVLNNFNASTPPSGVVVL